MKTLAKSMPLETEVVTRFVPANARMPAFWTVQYRGEVIREQMHKPSEQDVRDALQAHAARQQPAPLPPAHKYGRKPKALD